MNQLTQEILFSTTMKTPRIEVFSQNFDPKPPEAWFPTDFDETFESPSEIEWEEKNEETEPQFFSSFFASRHVEACLKR